MFSVLWITAIVGTSFLFLCFSFVFFLELSVACCFCCLDFSILVFDSNKAFYFVYTCLPLLVLCLGPTGETVIEFSFKISTGVTLINVET